MSNVTIVTVVRDWEMYEKLVRDNTCCKGARFVPFDNRLINQPIPIRYNNFLDSYDYSQESWFVFCHEDFEFQENVLEITHKLSKEALYGPIGHLRSGILGFGIQKVRGQIKIMKKNASSQQSWLIGRNLRKPALVETFDCCCVIVHSSLIRKYCLRFDERLEFDMYVEDFCAAANMRYKIPSYVVQMNVCHHSDAVATNRLWRHLPYLAEKYKTRCFTGTLTYFGTPSWQKRLQDTVWSFVNRLFQT